MRCAGVSFSGKLAMIRPASDRITSYNVCYTKLLRLLPVIQTFAGACGVSVETRDISLAGRILANFPDKLTEAQRVPDALAELGELATRPEANIIKLPNISASVPQLNAAIAELQAGGYDVPDYPEEPSDEAQREIRITSYNVCYTKLLRLPGEADGGAEAVRRAR